MTIATTVQENTDSGNGVLLQRRPFGVAQQAVVLQAAGDGDVRCSCYYGAEQGATSWRGTRHFAATATFGVTGRAAVLQAAGKGDVRRSCYERMSTEGQRVGEA